VEEGKDAQCDKCAAWGHSEFRCPQLDMLRCGLCAERHRMSHHVCQVAGCGKKGKCRHLQAKCQLRWRPRRNVGRVWFQKVCYRGSKGTRGRAVGQGPIE